MNKFAKKVVATSILAIATIMPFHAGATTLTFDEFSNGDFIPNGYGGLNWVNFGATDTRAGVPSGYRNGVISSYNTLFNRVGAPADFSSQTPFTFNSAYLTAAWNNGLTLAVTGYLADQIVDFRTITVNTSGPTFEVFNWTNIDRVNFVSSGGTPAGYTGSGTHFALDNLTINAEVPEPTTIAIFGLGLLGVATARRASSKRNSV